MEASFSISIIVNLNHLLLALSSAINIIIYSYKVGSNFKSSDKRSELHKAIVEVSTFSDLTEGRVQLISLDLD